MYEVVWLLRFHGSPAVAVLLCCCCSATVVVADACDWGTGGNSALFVLAEGPAVMSEVGYYPLSCGYLSFSVKFNWCPTFDSMSLDI